MSRSDIPEPADRDEELSQLAEALAASLVLERERVPGAGSAEPPDSSAASPSAAPACVSVGTDAPSPVESAAGEPTPAGSGSEPEPAPEGRVWLPRRVQRADLSALESEGGDVRFYAVWALCRASGDRQWAGVHGSRGTNSYSGLLLLNGGSFGGLRWRRAASLAAASALWEAEAPGKRIEHPIRFYQWEPKPFSVWDSDPSYRK